MGMMINRRRVYGGKKGLLPSGYTQLEYIESTRTQYINTGINNWNNTLEFEIKLEIKQSVSGKTYYGAYDVWSNAGHITPSIGTYLNYRMNTSFTAGHSSSIGTDIGIRDGQTGIISFKGDSISWSEGSSTQFNRGSDFTVNAPIILFALYVGSRNQAEEFVNNKMYYAKFWLDGNLVRNLIPAKRNSDNVLGMYDLVNNTFYTNAGTGDFIAGPEV